MMSVVGPLAEALLSACEELRCRMLELRSQANDIGSWERCVTSGGTAKSHGMRMQ